MTSISISISPWLIVLLVISVVAMVLIKALIKRAASDKDLFPMSKKKDNQPANESRPQSSAGKVFFAALDIFTSAICLVFDILGALFEVFATLIGVVFELIGAFFSVLIPIGLILLALFLVVSCAGLGTPEGRNQWFEFLKNEGGDVKGESAFLKEITTIGGKAARAISLREACDELAKQVGDAPMKEKDLSARYAELVRLEANQAALDDLVSRMTTLLEQPIQFASTLADFEKALGELEASLNLLDKQGDKLDSHPGARSTFADARTKFDAEKAQFVRLQNLLIELPKLDSDPDFAGRIQRLSADKQQAQSQPARQEFERLIRQEFQKLARKKLETRTQTQ